jgi:stage V sporulation protein S
MTVDSAMAVDSATLSSKLAATAAATTPKSTPSNGELRVGAQSQSKAVAGAIAHTIRGRESITILAAGARAVSNSVKAIAIARGFIAADQIGLACVPDMVDVKNHAYNFLLEKTVGADTIDFTGVQELKVGKGSKAGGTAGAIKVITKK